MTNISKCVNLSQQRFDEENEQKVFDLKRFLRMDKDKRLNTNQIKNLSNLELQ